MISVFKTLIIVIALNASMAKADGLDLNDALLCCIMSDGECLANTGIPILDKIFGKNDDLSHYDSCYYREWWYTKGDWWSSTGKYECRRVKMKLYIEKTFVYNYDGHRPTLEQRHLELYERGHSKGFWCTDNQREI